MNRWWGTKADSETQSSQRDSRAARRTIAALPVVSSDDEEGYEDCNLSHSFLINLDGNADSSSEEEENMPTIFHDENGTDDDRNFNKN